MKCRLSYNALLRLTHAGFTQLYWLRNGTKEWKENLQRGAGGISASSERQIFGLAVSR